MLIIVGLGTGSLDDLPLGVYKLLKKKNCKKYFRTKHHPVVTQLQEEGVDFQTFDAFYEEADDFTEVYRKIAEKIINEEEDVIYAVPGHPLVAEESVANIVSMAKEQRIAYRIQPAMSFLDQLFSVLGIDPINGLTIIDALQIEQQPPNLAQGNVLTQVYNRQVASDLKLTLMEFYPDDFEIIVLRALGIPDQEKVKDIKLYELDRIEWLDHLTTVYVPPLKGIYIDKRRYPLDPLVNLMEELRGESGCPWDKEQTHQTLRKHLLEETYEVLEALEEEDMDKLREELGDLLLQIVFHSQIASENEYFDINDVIMEIKEKLIRRHPHIFGDAEANTSGQVVRKWEEIKRDEKASKGLIFESALDNVNKTLPGLLKAEELQKSAAQVGFDWPDYKGALDKVNEELNEVTEALVTGGDIGKIEEELGDLLFAIVNFARFFKINPEAAVSKTNIKFSNRFKFMEKAIREKGLDMTKLSLKQLDNYWDLAKGAEKGTK